MSRAEGQGENEGFEGLDFRVGLLFFKQVAFTPMAILRLMVGLHRRNFIIPSTGENHFMSSK